MALPAAIAVDLIIAGMKAAAAKAVLAAAVDVVAAARVGAQAEDAEARLVTAASCLHRNTLPRALTMVPRASPAPALRMATSPSFFPGNRSRNTKNGLPRLPYRPSPEKKQWQRQT